MQCLLDDTSHDGYLVVFALQLFQLTAQCKQITLRIFQLPETKSSFHSYTQQNYIKIKCLHQKITSEKMTLAK